MFVVVILCDVTTINAMSMTLDAGLTRICVNV